MGHSMRFYAAGILMAAGLVGAALGQPAWLEAVGVEVAAGQTGSQESGSYLLADPDPLCVVTARRCEAKRQVVALLAEGKLSLFEAAARFRDLNTEPIQYPNRGYLLMAGATDEEKLCRQVIAWAASTRARSAPQSEVELLSARLEAELTSQLCLCGRITLPE